MADEMERIRAAIAALEGQRQALGDEVVETALAPLREKLASLQRPAAAEQPQAEEQRTLDEQRELTDQRKLVTVLFADLVGFTRLGEHMDPEELHDIIEVYFRRWSTSIEKRGGVVEKFIGDAVMAVFGLVVSREDDPENAVRAALDMREQMAGLNQELDARWGVTLAMRTGIHTGPVMVSRLGEQKRQDFVAVGDTVNLASRLQTAAPEGGILISHDTYRHVRGVFNVQMLEPMQVKGKEAPVQAYLVIAAKYRAFHMPTRGVEGVETHMIGRDAELQRLKDAVLAAFETRETQVVIISGEAGIGKSRLMAELDQWIDLLPQVIRYFKGRAGPSMENQPYSLLRDVFSSRFQIYDSDPPRAVQEKIVAGIGEFEYIPALEGDRAGEARQRGRAIGQLLGFKLEEGPAILDPMTVRSQAIVYLKDYFQELAAVRPIALLLEDIHWADDSSLDVLEELVSGLPHLPLAVVCAARPLFFERRPDWAAHLKVHTTRLALAPLSREDNQRLVEEILQRASEIPPALHDLITDSAEGNPFFTEELIKMLIENGVIHTEDVEHWQIDLGGLKGLQIPSTLVEVLQARFDSLSLQERLLLQRASVLGRVFWDEGVKFIEEEQGEAGQLDEKIEQVLRSLGSRDMIFPSQTTAFEETHEYLFKHALLRDVTYESVLKRLRKVYHAYAAQWLETVTRRSQRSEEYAAWIAEHYHLAEDHERAREWYRKGGAFAISRYANAEAVRCLTHCLQMWPEADLEGRIDLLVQRAKVYDTLADRPAQKEDLETLERLVEELRRSGAASEATINLLGARLSLQWWFYYDSQGDHQATLQTSERIIALAHSAGDVEVEAQGYLHAGASLWRRGDFAQGQKTLEKGLSLARQAGSRKLEADFLRNLGITLQYQEIFSEARDQYEAAQRLYEEVGDERGASMTANSLGYLFFERGELHAAREYFLRALRLKRKIGHRHAEHLTLYNLGLLDLKLRQYPDAQEAFEQTLVFFSDTGDAEGRADSLMGLANLARATGEFESARRGLAEALSIYQQNRSPLGIAEVLLVQAHLAANQGSYSEALERSQQAMQAAQELGQKGFQAQAAFWAGQALLGMGQPAEAHQSFVKAAGLLEDLGESRLAIEAQAGLAEALLAEKRVQEALPLAVKVLDYFMGGKEGGQKITEERLEGMDDPFQALLACYQVLTAAGDRHAARLLSRARDLLQAQAARLGRPEQQKSFLENLPAHREIIRMAEKGS